MKKLTILSIGTVLVISGCASNSGIVPAGSDTFMVSRQAATGFSGPGSLKAEALTEANTYCVSIGKSMQVVQINEGKPPFILGNYPRAEIQFKCNDRMVSTTEAQKSK